MAETTNQTYLGLISKAIRDFDSIYGALVERGVAVYPTVGGDGKYDTGIATEAYPTLIRKLYRIVDKSSNDVESLTSHQLELKDTFTASAGTINTQTGVISLTAGREAVVNSNSTITLTVSPVSIAITDLKKDETKHVYSYTAPANTIVKDVTIAAGSVELDLSKAKVSEWDTTTSVKSIALGTELGANILKSEQATGYTAFTVTPTMSVTGSKTVTLEADKSYKFTEGYIEAPTVTNASTTINTSGDLTPSTAATIYIQNAKLENVKANGSIGFEKSQIASVESSVDGYDIIAGAALTVSGDVTPGFLAAGTKLESDQATPITETYRIKKGKVSDVEITNELLAPSGDTSILSQATTNVYEITVKSKAVEESKSIEYGYIESGATGFKVTATEKSTTLKIAKGSVTAKASAKVNSVNGVGGSLTGGTDKESISINIQPEFAAADQVTTPGYILASNVTRTPEAAKDVTIYLNKSKVNTDTLTLTATVVDRDDDLDASSTNGGTAVNIFGDAAPSAGDYYEIDATSVFNVTAGYTSTGLSGGLNKKLYLPKAKLQYVEDSTAGNIIQVVSGGYLPSGTLADLSEITGTLDAASVKVTLNAPTYNPTSKKYEVTAVYNEVDSTIGYFNGSANFVGAKIELAQGTAEQTASIDSSIINTALGITSNGSNKYTVNITTTGKTSTVVTPGYITTNDLTVNETAAASGAEVVLTGNTTIDLNKATIGLKDTKVDLAATAKGFAFSDTETAFIIKPNFGTNHKVNIKPTAEGYIKPTDETEVVLTEGTVGEYYLKAGKVNPIAATAGNTKITLSADFDTKTSGDYSVVIPANTTVSATATIDEGYITAKTATGNVAVESNVLTVKRGAITPTITEVTTSLSSTEVVLSKNNNETGETYYAIKADASATSSATVSTVGYVKQTEVGANATANAQQATQYIKGIQLETEASSTSTNGKVYTVEGFGVDNNTAVDEATIATAERYAKYDIKVSLHADAMGSNVRSELARLEARLAGSGVSK